MTVEDQIEILAQTTRHGVCDACGAETHFRFIGTQEWPERVAQAMGFDGIVTLWRCAACDTTTTIKISDLT